MSFLMRWFGKHESPGSEYHQKVHIHKHTHTHTHTHTHKHTHTNAHKHFNFTTLYSQMHLEEEVEGVAAVRDEKKRRKLEGPSLFSGT